MIKRSLVRKLPSYGRLSWVAFSPAFSPSCQPHRHVIVEKCNRSGTREFRFEKIIGRKTLRFFRVKCTEVGSLFPRVRASIWKRCRQNVHRTVARAFHIKIVKNCQSWSTFGRWGPQNVHETVARARFHEKISLGEHFWKMGSAKCANAFSCSINLLPWIFESSC